MTRPPLDPGIALLLEQMVANGLPPVQSLGVATAREMSAAFSMEGVTDVEVSVEDRIVPGTEIPIRVYRPAGSGVRPVLVWLHDGGWVIGDLTMNDVTCRRLADGAQLVVVSVGYRLAPEHRFPAATLDVQAALLWVATSAASIGGDAERLAIGGQSAGANLAATAALWAREQPDVYLRHQLLVCPALDFEFESASFVENGSGYFLTTEGMGWFRSHYLGDHDPNDWRASPLRVPSVADVAPAHIITAEYDPLRDDGVRYAERLDAAGVPVVHDHYDDMIHGFFTMPTVTKRADEALDRAVAVLRSALLDDRKDRA